MSKDAFILDLGPGASVIENLTRQGFEVFLIDWIPPEDGDSWRGIDAYVSDALVAAVATMQKDKQRSRIPIVGYCLGGLLGLLDAAPHPDEVKALATLATPVDFSVLGFLLGVGPMDR